MQEYKKQTVLLEDLGLGTELRLHKATGMVINMHPQDWAEEQIPMIDGKPIDTVWTAELEERFASLYEGLNEDQRNTLTVVLAQIGQGVRKEDFYSMWRWNFTEAEKQMYDWKVGSVMRWVKSGKEISGILVEEVWKTFNQDVNSSPIDAMRMGLDLADKWNLPVLTGAQAFDPIPGDDFLVGDGYPTTEELVSMYQALGFEFEDNDWTYGTDMVYWPGNTGPLRR
jgi:hypothetical protein